MKRDRRSQPDWLSTPTSPSRIFNPPYRATIASSLPNGPGSLTTCAAPESPRHERRGQARDESRAARLKWRGQIQRKNLLRLPDAAERVAAERLETAVAVRRR